MKCEKDCKCKDCEMLDKDAFINIVDDKNPFNLHQTSIRGSHCQQYGGYSLGSMTEELKNGGIFKDDTVYTTEDNRIQFNGYDLIINLEE